jgi:hypothetical protein
MGGRTEATKCTCRHHLLPFFAESLCLGATGADLLAKEERLQVIVAGKRAFDQRLGPSFLAIWAKASMAWYPCTWRPPPRSSSSSGRFQPGTRPGSRHWYRRTSSHNVRVKKMSWSIILLTSHYFCLVWGVEWVDPSPAHLSQANTPFDSFYLTLSDSFAKINDRVYPPFCPCFFDRLLLKAMNGSPLVHSTMTTNILSCLILNHRRQK